MKNHGENLYVFNLFTKKFFVKKKEKERKRKGKKGDNTD